MGGGDIKLVALILIFFGFAPAALGLLLAGAFAAAGFALGKFKAGDSFPLGPFLCFGVLAWLLFY